MAYFSFTKNCNLKRNNNFWKFQPFKKFNKIIRVKGAKFTRVNCTHLDTFVEWDAYFAQEKTFEIDMNLNPELARTTTGRVGTCPPTKNAEIDNWNHIRDYKLGPLSSPPPAPTTSSTRLPNRLPAPPHRPPPAIPKKTFLGKKIVRM